MGRSGRRGGRDGRWDLAAGYDAKVDTLPEFARPTVEVQTEALGLSAEEVEQLITVPLEQDLLDGVAWLDKIQSTSVPGLSSVELIFEPGTDLYLARQVVQERLSQAAGLPNGLGRRRCCSRRRRPARTSMIVALVEEALSDPDRRACALDDPSPSPRRARAWPTSPIWGQRERQLQVQVDPQKLRQTNVTLEQVISSTGNALWVSPLTFLEASTPGTGGFIDTPTNASGSSTTFRSSTRRTSRTSPSTRRPARR